ncbi:DUF4041 domain-containing protein [Marinitoga sp. 1155]|uniref:DUF4041 domain-containing protein n=1 Tax=Marinitoga sp. 1155 TaxID=1428448 RepID=UPI000659133D|nr:DUF4041 domain-containing protein [Marinitoga sp. 1155]AMS33997.1 Chromosome segregation ATPase [Marinitoga camini virus 2]KLO24735.1 chromosome segregation ATPase [Marinitoga sp. 1155]
MGVKFGKFMIFLSIVGVLLYYSGVSPSVIYNDTDILPYVIIIMFILGIKLAFFSKGAKIHKIKKKVRELENNINRIYQEAKKCVLTAEKNTVQAKNLFLEKNEKIKLIEELKEDYENLSGKEFGETVTTHFEDEIEIKQKLEKLLKGDRNKISEAEKMADNIIINAQQKAQYLISEAEKKSKEILGDSYDQSKYIREIEKKVDELKNIEKALKNTINGYGNEYIIPTYTVLDELIEEYGYTEASQKIKEIRKEMKKMIKSRTAAECDYKDHYRANNAKDFVIDAFNGKVSTIMAKIKHDNYGILRQKIIDAYNLVNKLGTPFQNAKISKEYLQLRLDELKYGTFLKELKLKDMEEQRKIREQMREEEKARREIERALKQAEKEEKMLQEAMEKVRAEIEIATEEQKKKYEAQLEKLKQKLEEAEAKNQRALSMAQQTKSGHVYIISNLGSFGENVYKIGMTRRLEPLDRVRELGDASVPFPFDVHALIYSENAPELENKLHRFFEEKRMNKVNLRKEFFKVSISEIKEFLEKNGINAKWTIQAEAAEYRETLAIEEGLKKGTYTKDRFGHFVPVKIEEYENN